MTINANRDRPKNQSQLALSRERAKRKVELDLDRELEGTFPASDPLKITRGRPESRLYGNRGGDKKLEEN